MARYERVSRRRRAHLWRNPKTGKREMRRATTAPVRVRTDRSAKLARSKRKAARKTELAAWKETLHELRQAARQRKAQKRQRKQRIETEVLAPLRALSGQPPEVLREVACERLMGLADRLTYADLADARAQALAVIRKRGRAREFASAARRAYKRAQKLSQALDAHAAHLDTLWRATPSDFLSGEVGRSRKRRNAELARINTLAAAAELKLLSEYADDGINDDLSAALAGAFDFFFAANPAGLGATKQGPRPASTGSGSELVT